MRRPAVFAALSVALALSSSPDAGAAAQGVVPLQLYCAGGFMWYTTLSVGTPARDFNFTIDTGSSDFLLVDADCPEDACGNPPSQGYNASRSSSATILNCSQATSEGLHCDACSLDGRPACTSSVDYGGSMIEEFDLVKEFVAVPLILGTDTTMGATYNITSPSAMASRRRRQQHRGLEALDSAAAFPTGMWGLAYRTLTSSGAKTYFDELVSMNDTFADLFSVSLAPTGGQLILGGATHDVSSFTFVEQQLPLDFYRVWMVDFRVNGDSIGFPASTYNDPCILDTGTPTPTLTTAAYAAVVDGMQAMCKNGTKLHGVCDVPANESLFQGGCFTYDADELEAFPTFEFVISKTANKTQAGNASSVAALPYPPSAYLIPQYYCSDPSQFGFALQPDEHFTVLGASFMQGFEVLFDRGNQRVGFASQSSWQ